jgi:hypothetical protein
VGREARCFCLRNGVAAEVKAAVEPPELILRGGLRRRIPLPTLEQVRADGDALRFSVQGETFALQLGKELAANWAQALLKPPPSLAKKLGITAQITVRILGTVNDRALAKALGEAKAATTGLGDLLIACVHTPSDLAAALKEAGTDLGRGVPIWLVYPKGPGHALNETMVRSAGLSAGVVDTKVAAVSETLTGLRFVQRRKR